MRKRLLLLLLFVAPLAAQEFRALMRDAPRLPLRISELPFQAPGMVSSVAIDGQSDIYILQRGGDSNPVMVLNREGKVLRSWGSGLYKIPHSIRIDPAGDVWTVDAGNSTVQKYSREGKRLLSIDVGGLPASPKSPFCGTTDIAFTSDGRVFITDGYANARVLEYNASGKRVHEWGGAGTGPGQFRVPHGIAIDRDNILYVADRENGRIQRFHLDGRYIGEWNRLGKTFSLKITPAGDLWIGTQPRDAENGAEPWLVKVDRRTGAIIGAIESRGHHSIDVNADGEPLTGARPDHVLWFRLERRTPRP